MIVFDDEDIIDFSIPICFILECFYDKSYDECWWSGFLQREIDKMIEMNGEYDQIFRHDKVIDFFLNVIVAYYGYSVESYCHADQVHICSDIVTTGGDESWD